MTLTVLNVAYPFAPVGPRSVGGAEQVLSSIDRGLIKAGHRSLVIACEGSEAAGELITTPRPEGMISDARRKEAWLAHQRAIHDVTRRERVDLIHLHGIDFPEYLPESGIPTLVTLHLPPDWYVNEVFSLRRPGTYLLCVSGFQRRHCPATAAILGTIENGVEVAPIRGTGRHRKRRFAAALGRICPEKNLHAAMDAAAMADMPLLLAGEVFPYETHQDYFDGSIRPRLGPQTRFIGPVNGRSKGRLLRSARCVLIPSIAQETSSLVAMESLAAGTPVIAFRSGCLPDIVEHGTTGFIVNDVAEMARAIRLVEQIEPDNCQRAARERFDSTRMVRQYLEYYSSLAGHRSKRIAPDPVLCAAREHGAAAQGRVTLLRSMRELSGLREQWARLWRDDRKASVFQSPYWLLPWARWFAGGRPLTFATWDERGSLATLAPLYIQEEPLGGSTRIAGSRVLLPLGIGTTDYLDILVADDAASNEPDQVAEVIGAIVQQPEWDACELPQLRAGAHLLQTAPSAGFDDRTTESEPCFKLTLPGSPAQLWRSLPRPMAHNLRYYEQRARRAGTLAYSRADSRSLEEHVDALFRLHARRWALRGGEGVLSDAAVQGWHREVIEALDAAGLLRMYGLRLNGGLVAVHYGMVDAEDHGGAVYFYIGGFDPAFSSLSPGTLLIGHAVQEAVHEGAHCFDFLRGREVYKGLWGAHEAPTYCRRFERRTRVELGTSAQGRNAA